MVSPLEVIGLIPKTEKRRKSDEIKKKKGIDEDVDEECDWTIDGSPSIELPDLPFII